VTLENKEVEFAGPYAFHHEQPQQRSIGKHGAGWSSSSSSSSELANHFRYVSTEGPTTRKDGGHSRILTPGTYNVIYVHHEVRNLVGCRARELVMWFCVSSPGPAFGIHVPKCYNVGNADPDEASTNTFKVGFKSDLYRDYVRLIDAFPRGRNRIWINGFKDKIFKAEIHLVDRDGEQLKFLTQLTPKRRDPVQETSATFQIKQLNLFEDAGE
jgi:hypothetical protein